MFISCNPAPLEEEQNVMCNRPTGLIANSESRTACFHILPAATFFSDWLVHRLTGSVECAPIHQTLDFSLVWEDMWNINC